MDDAQLKEVIRASVGPDGKIRCAEAFRIAREAGVETGRVGRLLNELGIKIKGCQLGCF